MLCGIALQAGVTTGITSILLGILFTLLYIGMVVWTYSDATDNSPQSAVLWALVVFFAPLLGLLLYFLLGREQSGGASI